MAASVYRCNCLDSRLNRWSLARLLDVPIVTSARESVSVPGEPMPPPILPLNALPLMGDTVGDGALPTGPWSMNAGLPELSGLDGPETRRGEVCCSNVRYGTKADSEVIVKWPF